MTRGPAPVGRQCVILVGGLGTRLGALTEDRPKPLLDVAGRPFLEHLIREARRFGFDDFLLLAGFRHEQVEAFAAGGLGETLDCSIRVVAEPEPAGTGGALGFARNLLDERFLMMNGDSLFAVNLADLAAHEVPGGAVAGRIALRRVADAARYGVVELGPDRRIAAFRERPDGPGPGLVNGGVYYLDRSVLDGLTAPPCSLERDVFPALASRGLLAGFPSDGFFIDIGVPDDYARAQHALPAALRRPALFFDRDGVLNQDDGYTHRPDQFHWTDGAIAAVKAVNDAGWLAFVVTNQSGVARGLYDEATVVRLHDWINEQLRARGAHIDAFRYCPHHVVENGVERYAIACECRKPKPGMILDLLRHWPVDRGASLLIGDKQTDLEAARAAGIEAMLFAGGDLNEAVSKVLRRRGDVP